MKRLLILLITVIFLTSEVNTQYASPCPRIFTYEPKGSEPDRWYGLLTLLHDSDLNGLWLRIVFDKPILQLGNWFGEVVKKGPTDYLIKNPSFQLKARTPKVLRIFVKYNMYQPPPRLTEFRINAKVVCPEFVTTTTSTTTERLFTSGEEFPSNQNEYTTTISSVATTHDINSGSSGDDGRHEVFSGLGTDRPQKITNQNHNEICGTIAEQPRQHRHIGQVAYKGEFPWHAMLYYTKDITIVYLCGAALISKSYLLTVAHCVIKSHSQVPVNPERLIVYLGKYYVKHWTHEGVQTRYVSDITPHPGYNSLTYDNDIAILKLLFPADFTDYIRPICLWNEPLNINSITNRPGTVAGWGFDETGKVEDKLMFVQMFAQESDVCNRAISNYSEKFVSRKTYCANFIDDTVECVGDSGGAMVFPRLTSNRAASVWQLRGLVTVSVVLQHQLKCGRDRYVVFTDVTEYHDWIKQQTDLS